MRDTNDTDTGALDEGALLAAYLDGDTDDVTSRRLERRLGDDPRLADRLDAIASTRAQLQRLGDVTMPADARQRLRQRLAHDRTAPSTATDAQRQSWTTRLVPVVAAAALVLVAVLGATAVIPALSLGGDESAGEAAVGDDAAQLEAADGRNAESGAAPQALADEPADEARAGSANEAPAGPSRPPVTVGGDADIAERAARLREDPPTSLRRRERQLRRQAGLPVARTCVRDLDVSTVDLITEDGRTSLAVLLDDDSGQIVLLDPATCAPIRTISRQ